MIVAHRGFSARHPEMTRAAYREAIAWSRRTGVEVGLECDVQFSADDELICLHDLRLDRTSDAVGPAFERSVAQLRALDFGSWNRPRPSAAQRAVVTLAELLVMVAEARADRLPVSLVIETKHPNPRGLDIEDRVAAMLAGYGWDRPGSPVRVISFSEPALVRLRELLPDVGRTFLLEITFGSWADGTLPDGVTVAGPSLELVKEDPGYVARTWRRGNEVHVWTVNHPRDVAFCLDLGVTSLTTDDPDQVHRVLTGRTAAG